MPENLPAFGVQHPELFAGLKVEDIHVLAERADIHDPILDREFEVEAVIRIKLIPVLLAGTPIECDNRLTCRKDDKIASYISTIMAVSVNTESSPALT